MARPPSWLAIFLVVTVVVALGYIGTFSTSTYWTNPSSSGSLQGPSHTHNAYNAYNAHNAHRRCVWTEGDPALYVLRTKMGVSYEASHWFHMAENFMAQVRTVRYYCTASALLHLHLAPAPAVCTSCI
jgi:hypothetical protein